MLCFNIGFYNFVYYEVYSFNVMYLNWQKKQYSNSNSKVKYFNDVIFFIISEIRKKNKLYVNCNFVKFLIVSVIFCFVMCFLEDLFELYELLR